MNINLRSNSAQMEISKGEATSFQPEEKPKLIVRICDFLVSFSLFMIFLGLPVFFVGATFQGLAFEKQIYFYFWLLLALVSWAIKSVALGEMKIRRTSLDIPILAFLFVYLLATVFSVDRWHSFWGSFGDPSRGLAGVLALVLAYYIIFSNFSFKKIRLVLGALVLSNLALAVWTTLGIMNVNFLPEKISRFAPLSLIGSFSGLTVFFSLMIPLVVTAIVKSGQEMANKIFKIFSSAILFAVLALNLFLLLALHSFVSTAGWIAVLAGTVLFLVFVLSRIIRLPRSSWNWLPMAVFLVIIAFFMGGKLVNVARVNLPVEVSPNYQMSWDIARGALRDNFFLGSGPASYGYDFSRYRPQEFNLNSLYNLRFYQGSGAFFEALPTVGAAGTFFLVLIVLSFTGIGIYLLAREKNKDKVYSLGFFSAAAIFLVNLFGSRIEGPILILGTLVAMVSLATLFKESETEERHLSLSLKASPKFALALAFVVVVISASVIFLFVFLGKIFAADVYAGASNQNRAVSESVINKMARAIGLYDKEARYYVQLAQVYLALANQEALKSEQGKDLEKIKAYLNNSIISVNQAKELADHDVAVAEAAAQIYENAGFYAADSFGMAEESYRKALELEPHNPAFFLKLGQIKLNSAAAKKEEQEKKQLVEEAKKLFQQSVDEKNNFDPGYYNLALSQEALGDLDAAIENMGKAFYLDRSSINYAFNLGRLYQTRGKSGDEKIAESLFKQVLGVNDKEVNAHLQLGFLYQKTKEREKALEEYQKVLDLLPSDAADARERVGKFMENTRNGVENND